MFERGQKAPEPPEEQTPPLGSEMPMRIFSMPEELRGRDAILKEMPHKEAAPEALQPLIIPVPILPDTQAVVVQRKKRVSPALIVLFILVLMAGTGAGVWWYVVTYATPPQVIDTPVIDEPVIDDPLPPTPNTPSPGTDTDSDGLTNVEELLYGTDFRSPDSDGDTFLDGNEVFHRYDPNGEAPSTLLDTGAVRVLERADVPFTLYYPASWNLSFSSDNTTITFRSSDEQSIELTYEAKEPLTDLSAWMKEKDISLKDTEATMTKEGYPARNGEDGRTTYLDLGEWVVSAVYDLGDSLSIDFLQTFKMMMNSVDVQKSTDDVPLP